MSVRAGQALRQKWAQEAERARRAADPVLAAQDVAERAAMQTRVRVLARYGRLIEDAVRRGEITVEDGVSRLVAAQTRSGDLLERRRARILGR